MLIVSSVGTEDAVVVESLFEEKSYRTRGYRWPVKHKRALEMRSVERSGREFS